MMTLNELRNVAIDMQIPQTGKSNRYYFNEEHIAFVEGVTLYILPNIDIYKESIEEKGFVYDTNICIPFIESL